MKNSSSAGRGTAGRGWPLAALRWSWTARGGGAAHSTPPLGPAGSLNEALVFDNPLTEPSDLPLKLQTRLE